MDSFRIIIVKETIDDQGISKSGDIYEQTVSDLDVRNVICTVNKIPIPPTGA